MLQCLETMVGGEVFVPKIPSMNIMDLAKAIGPECRTEVVGVRPGEKLHEVMIPRDDSRNALEFNDFYVIKPAFRFFNRRFCENGCKPVEDGFEYSSGSNSRWLSVEELRVMIGEL